MLGPSGLGALAQQQLAAWQQIAMSWPVALSRIQGGLRCVDCDGLVTRLIDSGDIAYHVSAQQILDATVMHLRQRHEDLDPDR